MRTLYLIFSHDHQEQLSRLVVSIRRLSSRAAIAIHHDPNKAPLDITLFSDVPNVHIIPDPIHGEWGDFSLVEQYLHSFKWCLANLSFDWIVTLTGLSYPIMPLEKFEAYLEKSEFDAFVYYFDAFDPLQWPKGTGTRRYLFTYFNLPRNPYYYKVPAFLRAALSRIRVAFNQNQPFFRIVPMPRGGSTRLGIRRWKLPFDKNFMICGGRQMLNMNRGTLYRVFSYLSDNPRYMDYAKRTLIPDESFFTSIVSNEPSLRVCNDVLRYIKWPLDRTHAASVAVITKSEVDEVVHSGKPFALKFDSRIDADALDIVDVFLGLKADDHLLRKTV
jgi:hypothetical protein